MPLLRTTLLLASAAALASSAAARQEPQPEIPLDQKFPGFMGGGAFTTRFDPGFNPAIALVFDGLGTFSESDDAARNDWRLRAAELNFASLIDPLGWAYAAIAFADDGSGQEVELEEGAMWLDEALPGNFSLRAGKYLADFGKWNTIHLHDRAYVFQQGPAEAFFSGELNVQGAELHDWFGVGDVPLRWSLGVAPRFGEDAGASLASGATEFAAETLGRRTPSQFLYTGRLTAQHDAGLYGFFQWGVSALHTPAGLAAPEDADADQVPDTLHEAGQTTLGVDLTLRLPDAAAQTAHTASLEWYANSRDQWDPASGAAVTRDAGGAWAYYQYDLDPQWGFGVVASWWQDPATARGTDWFSGADAGSGRGVFATWSLSHFNRLRLQVGQDSEPGGRTSWTAAIQWTVILGNHAHALDW